MVINELHEGRMLNSIKHSSESMRFGSDWRNTEVLSSSLRVDAFYRPVGLKRAAGSRVLYTAVHAVMLEDVPIGKICVGRVFDSKSGRTDDWGCAAEFDLLLIKNVPEPCSLES
ncbi:hypothetical protein D9V29_12340 [Mycetocola manganoxydans]|uniref:Uncharacterized protein n=1 Tax=Mycetocola manganoxydans TaxID=699879 RepID=A0A3L6ZND1_9MICO|nr:hypothetical protein D9V29_12340 [Mycetocola manganoxydans]